VDQQGLSGCWNGTTTFLRTFVEANLEKDAEYRTHLHREAVRDIPIGLAMFIVAGGLFGLYCWYASWAPDPPPGHRLERPGSRASLR
jgi:hypothetical protein